jgi:hypothetical protein
MKRADQILPEVYGTTLKVFGSSSMQTEEPKQNSQHRLRPTVINIKILTNSNQQTQSYKFTSHITAFLSVVLITEMLEICIQTSYDQNVTIYVIFVVLL